MGTKVPSTPEARRSQSNGTPLTSALSFLSPARVSDERKRAVLDEIIEGSSPTPTYFVLLGLATLIAGFGLIGNSPAVVIGAMLVSPLMTPMFGVAVGLTRGNMPLIGHSLAAVAGGVVISIALGFLLGVMPFTLEVTSEMLARTRPTLIDLMVAMLAGLAGCLTWIDERVSPVLPGVAIATAIVPPLAACGLGLAFGGYEAAWGAFLLFLANFLGILAVSAAIFIIFGFFPREEMGSIKELSTRFAAAAIGLVTVAVLLTFSLAGVIEDARINRTISAVLESAFAGDPNTGVEDVVYDRGQGEPGLSVLAFVRTPRVLPPYQVQEIEQALSTALDEAVHLFVRCTLTRDVGSTGSGGVLVKQNLDGSITRSESHPDVRIAQVSEQVIREHLVNAPDVALEDVQLFRYDSGPLVLATVRSSQIPVGIEVQRVEELIQERIGDSTIQLLARTVRTVDVSDKGRVLLGQAHVGVAADEAARHTDLEGSARKEIEALGDFFVSDLDIVEGDVAFRVRAQVAGRRILSPKEVRSVEARLAKGLDKPVAIAVWWSTDLLVTNKGYNSVRNRLEAAAAKRLEKEHTAQARKRLETTPDEQHQGSL